MPVTDETNGVYMKSLITFAEMFSKKFICPGAMKNDILHKVEYTDDKNLLYPQLLQTNGTAFTIALGELGKYKNLHWSFQNEWRYTLLFFPLNLNQSLEHLPNAAQIMGNKIRLGLEKQPFPYYDMTIDDSAYQDMEITLSPRISLGNRLIVDALREKYNPSASVNESSLLGLL